MENVIVIKSENTPADGSRTVDAEPDYTAGRETAITRDVIHERVNFGPRVIGESIDSKSFHVASGTLMSKIAALAVETDLESQQIRKLLKDTLKEGNRDDTEYLHTIGPHLTSGDHDDGEKAMLNSEHLWPTFVKVMLDVASDLLDDTYHGKHIDRKSSQRTASHRERHRRQPAICCTGHFVFQNRGSGTRGGSRERTDS